MACHSTHCLVHGWKLMQEMEVLIAGVGHSERIALEGRLMEGCRLLHYWCLCWHCCMTSTIISSAFMFTAPCIVVTSMSHGCAFMVKAWAVACSNSWCSSAVKAFRFSLWMQSFIWRLVLSSWRDIFFTYVASATVAMDSAWLDSSLAWWLIFWRCGHFECHSEILHFFGYCICPQGIAILSIYGIILLQSLKQL